MVGAVFTVAGLLCVPQGRAAEPAPEPAAAETSAAAPAAGSEAPETSAKEEAATEQARPWISGSVETTLDLEHSGRDSDAHLDEFLNVNVDPPKCEHLHLRGSVWAIEDLDGKERLSSSLRGLDDTSDRFVDVRLLSLYLEADDLWGSSELRLGRQRILENPVYPRIDGLYFKQQQARWDWYVFGGARASLYEDAHKDAVAGGGFSVSPTNTTRVALDGYYGEEHRARHDEVYLGRVAERLGLSYPRDVREAIDAHTVAVTVTQRLTSRHSLYGRYTWYDGESDALQVSATGFFTKRDLSYDLTYSRRLSLLDDRPSDVSGYYRVLGQLNEYQDVLGTLNIPLNSRFSLTLEGQYHDSDNDTLESGNRDYQRYGAILNATELPHGFEASLGLENWDVSQGENTWTVTGEVARKWQKMRWALGADYAAYEDRYRLYQPQYLWANKLLVALVPGLYPNYRPLVALFDVAVIETHENIHSIYTTCDYEVKDNQDLRVQVRYEEDDSPDSPYWRIEARYCLRF